MGKKRSIVAQATLVLMAALARAQEPAPLPTEAPKALFSAQLGDEEVEVRIQGFWSASILSSGSLSLGPSGSFFNPVPFLFQQRPDLYILLTFRRQWWFEATVVDDLSSSSFALGFSGDEDDQVKEARLGNTGIGMPSYPYLSFGSPAGSFGAILRAGNDTASYDAVVRWDGLSWRTRDFFGMSESSETTTSPVGFIRGRRFVLPAGSLTSLRLYDVVGSDQRLLASGEYAVSMADGLVLLAAAPLGDLVAYYSTGGPETNVTLYTAGADLSANPNELGNLYALSGAVPSSRLYVRPAFSSAPSADYEVRSVAPGLVEVIPAGVYDPRDPSYRLPFAAAAPWTYDELPEDSVPPYPLESGFLIASATERALERLDLEQGSIPGTVQVERNGQPSSSFSFDQNSGELTLVPPPRPGEAIRVRYAVQSQDRSDGGLVFGAGARFPWLGLDWAVAVGGRWSLPGQAWAESGKLRPGWAGLSAEAAREWDQAKLSLDAFARYARDSSSGVYRIQGMEPDASALVPLRPDAATAPDALSLELAGAQDLYEGFPNTLSVFSDGVYGNVALKAEAGVSSGGTLVCFVSPVPLASFKRLALFAKAEGGPSTLALTLDGEGGAAVLVPAITVDPAWSWVSIQLDLADASHPWTATDASGTVRASGNASVDLSASASAVRLTLGGLDAGEAMLVDEIVLLEPVSGFALTSSLAFSAGDAANKDGAYVELAAVGMASDGASLAGTLSGGWTLGPSQWRADVSPSWADGGFSVAAGYTLDIPSRDSPIRFGDRFSAAPDGPSYAHALEGILAPDEVPLRLAFDAKSEERLGRLAQAWAFSAGWDTAVSLDASASLETQGTDLAAGGLAEAWLGSFRAFLPVGEDIASSRVLSGSLSAWDARIQAELSSAFGTASSAGPAAIHEAALTLRFPLALSGLELTPYYRRSTSRTMSSAAAGFAQDVDAFILSASSAAGLWSAWPLADALIPAGGAAAWAEGSVASSHRAVAGLSLKRESGARLLDLFLPSSADLSASRNYASADDSLSAWTSVDVILSGSALNLFARNGSRAAWDSVEFDEYGYGLDLRLKLYDDGAVLPYLSARHSMALDGAAVWTLSAVNTATFEATRSAPAWSEALSLSLTRRPGATWFGSLVGLILSPRADGQAAGQDEGQPPAESGSVRAWLDAAWAVPPALRETWTFAAQAGATPGGTPSIKTTLSYETRCVQAGVLSLGFRVSLAPSVSFGSGGATWGGSYELALDGTVSF
ncbi:MAG: hypothetical protein JW923_01555 [Spirochaetales bacterium]|nr:hypothetical protein [Spirochaetales bacterium]